MSNPVIDPRWAGDFSCSECGRKRLTAAEFSKRSVQKRRANPEAAIKCKTCVAKGIAAEQEAASSKPATTTSTSGSGGGGGGNSALAATEYVCSACGKSLPAVEYSGSQLHVKKLAANKQRCRGCVADANAREAEEAQANRQAGLTAAREATRALPKSSSAGETLAALSRESAAEAQLVTGLSPIQLGSGRGRSRGRGRGRGAGGSWRARGRARGKSK